MRLAFRIAKRSHAGDAFSGEGARRAGGRWNRPGDLAVYASDSLALAALETFAHLGEEGLGIVFVYFRIEIPDDVAVTQCGRPPRGWRAEPPGESSMAYGSRWLAAGETAVQEVPSAIVPSEHNYLLNPRHPDFGKLAVARPKPFSFDPRLWKP